MNENKKFFLLPNNHEVSLSANNMVIKQQDLGELLSIKELSNRAKTEAKEIVKAAHIEKEKLFEEAKKTGFDQGLKELTKIIAKLEEEGRNIRQNMESLIIKVAIKAARTMIGKELEDHPKSFANLVATSLKSVSEHGSVVIYCSKEDYENINENRPFLKNIMSAATTFSITPKEGLPKSGYIIQTDRGVINNSDVEKVWSQLEEAFNKQIQPDKGNTE